MADAATQPGAASPEETTTQPQAPARDPSGFPLLEVLDGKPWLGKIHKRKVKKKEKQGRTRRLQARVDSMRGEPDEATEKRMREAEPPPKPAHVSPAAARRNVIDHLNAMVVGARPYPVMRSAERLQAALGLARIVEAALKPPPKAAGGGKGQEDDDENIDDVLDEEPAGKGPGGKS